MPDVSDDVRAAFEAAQTPTTSSGTPPTNVEPGSSHDDFAPQKSETLPPVLPDNKDAPKPPKEAGEPPATPRDPATGRFQRTDAPAPPQDVPPAGEQPPDDSVHFDPAKPPSSWRKEAKDKWNSIPEDIRQEITRREEATALGVQKLMQQYEPMQEVYNALTPYSGYFQHIQADVPAYLASMMNAEQTLRLGNPAQKMEMVLSMADAYGIQLRQVIDQAMGGKLQEVMQQAHQHHQTPNPVPPEIMRELNDHRQWRAQMEDTAASDELAAFAAEPGHEFLDHVREDMANLLEAGVVETYQDAYDLACFRNPEVRAGVQARQAGEAQLTGVKARQAAAAAVVAPSGAPLVTSTDEPKDAEDTYEAVRRAWNAAASGGGV